jgi:hypothetical protein
MESSFGGRNNNNSRDKRCVYVGVIVAMCVCDCHNVFHSLKTIVSTSCSSVSLYQFSVVYDHYEKQWAQHNRLHTTLDIKNRTAGKRDLGDCENRKNLPQMIVWRLHP